MLSTFPSLIVSTMNCGPLRVCCIQVCVRVNQIIRSAFDLHCDDGKKKKNQQTNQENTQGSTSRVMVDRLDRLQLFKEGMFGLLGAIAYVQSASSQKSYGQSNQKRWPPAPVPSVT